MVELLRSADRGQLDSDRQPASRTGLHVATFWSAVPARQPHVDSGAIDGAMRLFGIMDMTGPPRDNSGGGPNNNGWPVTQAREDALAQGVTINGLTLLIRPIRVAYMDIKISIGITRTASSAAPARS